MSGPEDGGGSPGEGLDPVAVQVVVMALLGDDLAEGEPPGSAGVPEARTALAALVCRSPGTVAGLPVAGEAFRRLGARLRPLVEEGRSVAAGTRVAEVGGPLRAVLAARRTALFLLERLSAVASGTRDPSPDDALAALDGYASGLRAPRGPEGPGSPAGPGAGDGPRFDLEVLEVQG